MQNVSAAFHAAAAATARILYCRIIIGQGGTAKTVTESDDLRTFTCDRRAFTDAKLVGNILPATAVVVLTDRDGGYAALPAGTRFSVELGIGDDEDLPEYVTLPPLYISEGGITADTVKKMTTIKLTDTLGTAGQKKIIDLPEQTYPETRLAYLLAVCDFAGLTYSGEAFLGADIPIPEPPNLSGSETALEVIGRMAEAALCNAIIRADEKLYFIPIMPQAEPFAIPPEQYRNLKSEPVYGPVNRLILARRPQNDDVAREDTESIAANGLTEFVIADNPFLDYSTTDHRGDYIDALFAAVDGLRLPGYALEWKGNPALEPGDTVRLTDVSDNTYTTLYNGETLRYTGGLSAKAAMPYPKLSTQMAKGATTVKEAVSRAEIAVDKVSGEITAVVQAVEDTQNYVNGAVERVTQENSAAIEISKGNILDTVEQIYTTKTETQTVREELSSSINQTAQDVEIRFAQAQESTQQVADDLLADKTERETYIRFDADGMELGKTDRKIVARLENDRLSFLESGREVAYISDSKLYITQAEILTDLQLGKFAYTPRNNGNLSLLWKG